MADAEDFRKNRLVAVAVGDWRRQVRQLGQAAGGFAIVDVEASGGSGGFETLHQEASARLDRLGM